MEPTVADENEWPYLSVSISSSITADWRWWCGGYGGEVVRGDGGGGRWHESRLPHLNTISGTIWLARNDLDMQISPEYPLNEVALVRWTP